ncbi:MAG: tetratricopeptide repeat protein [Chloroflexi bacterium]|nr:tetratricopeptide repeat protein [Chloroflexota bacterium]
MLTATDFVANLESLEDPAEQRRLLEREAATLTDEIVQYMKARANELLSSNIARGQALADQIVYASRISGNRLHHALGLMVQANVAMLQGEAQRAISLYDEARQWALEAGNPVEAARSQIGKIGALNHLGDYRQALEIALETGRTLAAHNEPISAAVAFMSAGNSYCHFGEFGKALEEMTRARELLEAANSPAARKQLCLLLYNMSVVLRELGRYREALEYSLEACEIARQFEMYLAAATYQQGSATCYYLLGEYNKALRLLQEAREVVVANGLIPLLITGDFYTGNCYLELGRYEEAVAQAEGLIKLLTERDMTQTWHSLQAHYMLGRALIALRDYAAARPVLDHAEAVARQLGSTTFSQFVDLRLAEIFLADAQTELARAKLSNILAEAENTQVILQAKLLLAHLEATDGNFGAAIPLTEAVLASFEEQKIFGGLFQGRYLLGEISEKSQDYSSALEHYEVALSHLEHLRGRIETETRSLFLRSKEHAYEAAVALSLETGQPDRAFHQAERVKSRALADLVGNGLDIRVKVRNPADRPIVEEIETLRQRHNNLTSRVAFWQAGPVSPTEDTKLPSEDERQDLLTQTFECERRLAELTQRLQVRNAAYAEDTALVAEHRPFDPALLGEEEGLLEYYVARGEVLAFVVTARAITPARRLCTLAQLNRQLGLFRLNLAGTVKNLADAAKLAPGVLDQRQQSLLVNSRALLAKLYMTLFAPVEPFMADIRRLIIVPHGSLHYLPFHALYNAARDRYLLESFDEITYLPAASLLAVCRERGLRKEGEGSLVFGFSNQGALPCAVEEAGLVGQTLQTGPLVEAEATLANFRRLAATARILHLATHGRYREDAPLFSSLLLADGELTVHELLNMELQAALVTFSACETGLGAIGGGDEVQGLSRACLYAGAGSLALALWRVDDRAGSLLMQEFYQGLLQGSGKSAALRRAQLSLLSNPAYRHPFYWAPFILVGDSSPL